MGVNAGSLWGHVGTYAHHPAGQLIGELESLKLQIVTGASKQRFEVFNQRGNYQLVAPALASVHYIPAQGFNLPGQWRQNVFHPVRQ
jgi:predicted mannosyl-3-phosphoglycerate phosphatase (HAD superfamily)